MQPCGVQEAAYKLAAESGVMEHGLLDQRLALGCLCSAKCYDDGYKYADAMVIITTSCAALQSLNKIHRLRHGRFFLL